jgi:hypothetical protein
MPTFRYSVNGFGALTGGIDFVFLCRWRRFHADLYQHNAQGGRSGGRRRQHYPAAPELTLTADELACLTAASELPAEYPGWMIARQTLYRFPEPPAEA